MDWGKIAGDVTTWTDKVAAKLNEAGDKAKEKIEEAKFRLQPPITIGHHNVMIIKKIADGGFSEVFLARSADNPDEKFALKRMVCQNGPAKADAKAEMKILKTFSQHPNIITVLGGSAKGITVPGQSYESMEVHMLFPLYERGTAFDVMWSAMETRRVSGAPMTNQGGSGGSDSFGRGFGNDNLWPFPEIELVSVLGGVSLGLIAMHQKGFAHRDIKPHNVLIGPRGGVLMDLGSAEQARRDIATKKDAMKCEDEASIKCSAPYRAPELTEVQYPCSLDESVDVWSLGCTAYAMAFNAYSPFESEIEGVKRLAILNGKFIWPPSNRNIFGCDYSKNFVELVNRMLSLDASKRPTMMEVKNCLECLGQEKELPTIHGRRNRDQETEDMSSLKTYLDSKQKKDAEQPSSSIQEQQPTAPTAPHTAPHRQPPVVQTTPPPVPRTPEPNLLDFDSFQAPISHIVAAPPVPDDEFGDFEGGEFGDFVGSPTPSTFETTPDLTHQPHSFQQQPVYQQQQPMNQQQQQQQPVYHQQQPVYHQQQPVYQQQQPMNQQQQQQQPVYQQQQQPVYQQQQPMNQQFSHQSPMTFHKQPYVDPFAEAAAPAPPTSSPFQHPSMSPNFTTSKSLDSIDPFSNM